MMIRLHTSAACVLAAAAGIAAAQDATPVVAMPGSRERLLAAFDAIADGPLRAMFLQCARDSSERMLGLDEAVPCAMAWDALLKRGFNGDIDALLAWWRAHRNDVAAR